MPTPRQPSMSEPSHRCRRADLRPAARFLALAAVIAFSAGLLVGLIGCESSSAQSGAEGSGSTSTQPQTTGDQRASANQPSGSVRVSDVTNTPLPRLDTKPQPAPALPAPPAQAKAHAFPAPPPTRIDNARDTYFGVTVVDPYRWLEGDNSNPENMGAVTDEVAAWTDAQNAHTRSILDNLPGRARVEARLRELMEVGSVSAPRMAGARYFYSKREGTENQPRVFVREGAGGSGKPRLLLDPNTLDEKGLVTVSWFTPSHDGKLLAYGTYRSGDENSVLHLMDVDTGEKLPTTIPNKVSGVTWLPDNSGFAYRNLAQLANPYSGQLRFHRIGSDISTDPLIIRQFTVEENKDLATTWGPWGGLSKDGKWGLIGYSTGTRNNDYWAFDFAAFAESGKVERIEIITGDQSQSYGTVIDGILYLQTTNDAPNGRLVAVDLSSANPADRSAWRTVVPERKDAVIESVDLAKGIVAVTYMVNAANTIELFGLDGSKKGSLRLPGIGSTGLSTDQDRTEAFLSFTSFNYPTSIFRVDLANPAAEPQLWERPEVPVNPDIVEVKQEWYSSKDGTRVPMFIVHRKGLKLDGSNPTILNGYGGFNVSQTPFFSPTLFQWFESGGVFAIPNLRGGGEFGKEWHDAGKLDRKQNVFDDFIAAAEHLIDRGYTRPSRLAISGGSNGGLLTGAVVAQRPELFAAAISAVPLLDMLRFEKFLMAKYWVPEYGSAQNKEHFEFIRAYSPYHNIKPGVKYPAMFITAGENDTRVHALHARKMAALMQAQAAARAGDSNPVLLWVDRDAGHGQGKPLNLRIRDAADSRMFVMWRLGMLEPAR
ncbi:MAG: S9 family peptidase [Phycisphaeraceae bacterium]|nr:S9 family peptidase [Phycisphaeraceae bacterium]